jgi:hypothetical protein
MGWRGRPSLEVWVWEREGEGGGDGGGGGSGGCLRIHDGDESEVLSTATARDIILGWRESA